LIEDGSELRTERAGAREEPVDRLARVAQLLHVGQEAAGFHREQESGWGAVPPGSERVRFRESVEGVVDLDGVEGADVVVQPVGLPELGRIEGAAPVFVVPA
jgi:hypothetical protein